MEDVTINLTAIAAIWMGGALFLVPIFGLVLRYGVAPAAAALVELRRSGVANADRELHARIHALEERVFDLEAQRGSRESGVGVA